MFPRNEKEVFSCLQFSGEELFLFSIVLRFIKLISSDDELSNTTAKRCHTPMLIKGSVHSFDLFLGGN